MENAADLLETCALFQGLTAKQRQRALGCLAAGKQRLSKGQVVLTAGEPISKIGILLEGGLQVVREEYTGERTIVTAIQPGELFAEAVACAPADIGGKVMPVTVLATVKSAVLWMDVGRMLTPCGAAAGFQSKLLENLLGILAGKNLLLNQKMRYLSKRTTREKLLAYLTEQAAQRHSSSFEIPFTHQELADYLCVERSGLSAVLSGLRREGLLSYERRRFHCFFLEEKHP